MRNRRLRNYYIVAGVLWLFQKSIIEKEITTKVEEKDKEKDDSPKIRCPLCQWQPKPSSRWCCAGSKNPENFFNGCGTVWNTFTTRGICPGCQHHWRWTSCLSCRKWSLHEDWYSNQDAS